MILSQQSQRSYGNNQSRRSLELFFSDRKDRNNRSDLSDRSDHMETGLRRRLFGLSLSGGLREVVLSGGLITT